MDSCTIHNTPAGLALETSTELYLISQNDFPRLTRQRQTVPVRDQEGNPLSPGKYAAMAAGKVSVYLQSEPVIIPVKCLTDRTGIKRVFLSSSPSCGVV